MHRANAFVAFYYRVSPPVVDFIASHEGLRMTTRFLLTAIIYGIYHKILLITFTELLVDCYMCRKKPGLIISRNETVSNVENNGKSKLGTVTILIHIYLQLVMCQYAIAVEPFCPGGTAHDPAVLWCDDFEDATPLSQKYFEYDNNGGDFIPAAGAGLAGSKGMQVKWQQGEVDAGNIKRTFGRSPVNSQSHSSQDFREIYWRIYVKTQDGWTGNPYKLSRATIFAQSNWAQAMIAHIWGDGTGDTLMSDPTTGIDVNGNLVTTTWNDFANLRWLGYRRGTTPVFALAYAGVWHSIEAHVKLNTPGYSDGVFEFWIDGNLESQRTDLNWVDTWQEYGINGVFFENYWNGGAPNERVRYFDNIVISTKRIGSLDTTRPAPPKNLTIN